MGQNVSSLGEERREVRVYTYGVERGMTCAKNGLRTRGNARGESTLAS